MSALPNHMQSGFFGSANRRVRVVPATQKQPCFVDVGGNGDCGFRAVAAGLLDNIMNHNNVPVGLLKRVLTRHLHYFPNHRPALGGLLTPQERIQQLLHDVKLPVLVQTLAYTLRQIAVDEIVHNPERYPGVFADQHEHTSPADMRKPATWIDESAIAALAHVLDMPIEVQVVERNKPLPLKFYYNKHAQAFPVVVQRQRDHYIPRVLNRDAFSNVRRYHVQEKPNNREHQQDPELANILDRVANEQAELLDVYESVQHQLITMVSAGELTKEDLLKFYVDGMGSSDYLRGRVKYVGTEYGSQDFFENIQATKEGMQPVILESSTKEAYVVGELIHALARAISIGHLSKDEMFSGLEQEDTCQKLAL